MAENPYKPPLDSHPSKRKPARRTLFAKVWICTMAVWMGLISLLFAGMYVDGLKIAGRNVSLFGSHFRDLVLAGISCFIAFVIFRFRDAFEPQKLSDN